MRHSARLGLARVAMFVVLAAATAAPAAAQIGGLKKKIKAAAGTPEPEKSAQPAAAPAGGGAIVLSDDILNRLIAGLHAGKTERVVAAKEDTPYGRYLRADSAYRAAKAKCDAAAAGYGQRMGADLKLMEKNNALLEKMIAAQQKQDTALQRVYADSMVAMQDPSCVVKEPRRPDNWYDLQREVDGRAEQQELKASGFERQELGAVRDRTEAIVRDAPPPDVSSAESDAVKKRSDELKRLMNIDQVPPARAEKPAPAPAAAPPQPAATGMSADQAAMMDCLSKNADKHKKEIERLARRLEASEGGDMQTTLAIADSIQRLQYAGCTGK
ncbi:MAG TPA: hypothetical protein VH680_18660 [Gemmatimonadales bacterium]